MNISIKKNHYGHSKNLLDYRTNIEVIFKDNTVEGIFNENICISSLFLLAATIFNAFGRYITNIHDLKSTLHLIGRSYDVLFNRMLKVFHLGD